jgi:serine/threonine protein kinase
VAGISQHAAKFYIAAISLPLLFLHRRGIAYRDLKPENIMIDKHGYPKLIDFGLSKQFNFGGNHNNNTVISMDFTTKTYTLCGTPEYMAPEMILGKGHNLAVDWWSLGVVLYEMVVGMSPFSEFGVSKRDQNQLIVIEVWRQKDKKKYMYMYICIVFNNLQHLTNYTMMMIFFQVNHDNNAKISFINNNNKL